MAAQWKYRRLGLHRRGGWSGRFRAFSATTGGGYPSLEEGQKV